MHKSAPLNLTTLAEVTAQAVHRDSAEYWSALKISVYHLPEQVHYPFYYL